MRGHGKPKDVLAASSKSRGRDGSMPFGAGSVFWERCRLEQIRMLMAEYPSSPTSRCSIDRVWKPDELVDARGFSRPFRSFSINMK